MRRLSPTLFSSVKWKTENRPGWEACGRAWAGAQERNPLSFLKRSAETMSLNAEKLTQVSLILNRLFSVDVDQSFTRRPA